MSTAAFVPLRFSASEERAEGIAADELAHRVAGIHNAIGARHLRAWLLEQGLAVETRAGLLQPTPAALEIADFLHPRGVQPVGSFQQRRSPELPPLGE